MIKYLGSKRTLVPALGAIASAVEARTAVDLFTGTTRVAQEFKRRGILTIANDTASYSHELARTYIATDATTVDRTELGDELARLNALPGVDGYVTETFCRTARFFQPHNGRRVDAIRDAIEQDHPDTPLRPILLTSLLLAADRVDSTTGLQMAFLKDWAPRASDDLLLQAPLLLDGAGESRYGDAAEVAAQLPRVDLAYLDPPYNQHRYFTNYHVWETLVRWDRPEHYGKVCKRADAREEATHSPFNSKVRMPEALRGVIAATDAETVLVSYNDESWVPVADIEAMLREAGHAAVGVLAFDRKRYVGAQIGIFNGAGERVGAVNRLRNTEYVLVAGPADKVAAAVTAATAAGALPTAGAPSASRRSAYHPT